MKVLIYKPKGTEFADDWLYAADQGFKALGAEVHYFENIDQIRYAPDNIVIGFIEDTIAYFDKHGVNYPKPLNIPINIHEAYVGRKIRHSFPIHKVMDLKGPIFIKPANRVKEFSAGVIQDPSKLLNYGVPSDGVAMVSEVMNFKSEYRCFVHNKKVVGMKHYAGDIGTFPNMGCVGNMIRQYSDSPVAYTLDVGIVVDEESMWKESTFLVECNDAWSVCNYGLDPVVYAKMLRDRWFELTGYRKFDEIQN